METVILNVQGMSCGSCVNSIKNVLQAINGVISVDVSLEKAQAIVKYDAGKASVEMFKHAIEDAGYDVAS